MRIYFDYAATTPMDSRVLLAMKPYLTRYFGNPSSLHQEGQIARQAIEQSRRIIADFLGCQPAEIIFTSGATESNNLALRGIVQKLRQTYPNQAIHILTSQIEHHAILEPCQRLEKAGIAVNYLAVQPNGIINPLLAEKAIKENTVLVTIMYVNNEIGTIQPISIIGEIVQKIRLLRKQQNNPLPIYFHTDAAQALSYCNCRVQNLGVDLMSLSGHKIYGPKGVGALYVKQDAPLSPLQYGGHQENSRRAGTENVAGIVGFGKAVELLRNAKKENLKIKKLRDYLLRNLQKKISGIQLNGDPVQRAPNNLNVRIQNIEGESVLMSLDLAGIAVSTGSACSSASLEPSHVLAAMNLSPEVSHGSIRITLGRFTTKKEIARLLNILPKIVMRLRKIAPES